MLQTSENYNNNQEPINKTWKIIHNISCKTESYRMYNMQPTVCP